MLKEIEAHFDITDGILETATLQDFLAWLCEFDSGKWRPEKYNNADPVKYTFSAQQIDEVIQKWQAENIGMVFKRTSSPKYELDFTGQRAKLLVKNEITAYFDPVLFREPQATEGCLEFLKQLYVQFKPAYGYAVHRKDYLGRVAHPSRLIPDRWEGGWPTLQRC